MLPLAGWPQEAEHAVLGSILLDPGAFERVHSDVGMRGADLVDPRHSTVYAAAADLHAAGVVIDLVSVCDALRGRGELERVGGVGFLSELCLATPNPARAADYARQVVAGCRERRRLELRQRIKRLAAGDSDDAVLRADLHAALDELEAFCERPGQSPAIPLEWAADMPDEIEARPQMVEGLFNIGDLAMIYGASNSGKSYFAGHMSMCITEGADFLGRRTRRGAVLYVAGEGPSSIRARLAAYRRHFGRSPGRFGLIPCALNLMDPSTDVDDLVQTVVQAARDIEESVSMIVIDTVARAMVGGDENTGVDMARLVGACDRIRAKTGATLLLIHHAGKDESRGARGHSSLRAALDTEIEVSKDDALKTHYAKVTKQRDLGGAGEKLAFKLVPVELSLDEWGNPVTACAVVAEDCEQKAAGPRRLTAAQQAVLAYLAGHKTGARRAVLVAALEPQGVARASVYRAVNELLNGGIVVEVAGQVYLPKESA